MNILPKKRWHVLTKENIARVKEDEAKYAEEQRQKTYRSLLANQEARTEALRKRNRGPSIAPDAADLSVFAAATTSSSTLLPDQSVELIAHNKEYEEEKRKDCEAKEKSIGLLTYLGQSVLDAAGQKPWYSEPRTKHVKRFEIDQKAKQKDEWDAKNKLRDDPLTRMNQVSDWFEKQREENKREESRKLQRAKSCISAMPELFPNDIAVPKSKAPSTNIINRIQSDDSTGVCNNSMGRRNACQEPATPTPVGSAAVKLAKQLQLDRLRTERLQRERSERDRAAIVLAQSMGLPQANQPAEEEEIPTDERRLPFNSAFNPELSAALAERRQRSRESRRRRKPSELYSTRIF